MVMIKCSKCGELVEDGKNYCPNCGNSLTQKTKKTGKPIVGGILLIIASCFSLIAGIYILFTSFDIWLKLIIVIFDIWGFAIGLTGGILTLKRIHYPIAIIGTAFVLVAACLSIIGAFPVFITNLILGILIAVFITSSKKEFKKRQLSDFPQT
jgi:RNA polymerase subunit RPABC4/transcription elongation factor Spt4